LLERWQGGHLSPEPEGPEGLESRAFSLDCFLQARPLHAAESQFRIDRSRKGAEPNVVVVNQVPEIVQIPRFVAGTVD